MTRDVLEIIGMIVGAILLLIAIVLVVNAVCTPFFIIGCNRTAKQMNTEYKYDFWAGCFLQLDDGNWVKDDYFVVPELRD